MLGASRVDFATPFEKGRTSSRSGRRHVGVPTARIVTNPSFRIVEPYVAFVDDKVADRHDVLIVRVWNAVVRERVPEYSAAVRLHKTLQDAGRESVDDEKDEDCAHSHKLDPYSGSP